MNKMKKSYLKFIEYQLWNKKTKNVTVINLSEEELGEMSWDTGWRRYTFNLDGLKFDAGCLKEIADYLDKLMEEKKQR